MFDSKSENRDAQLRPLSQCQRREHVSAAEARACRAAAEAWRWRGGVVGEMVIWILGLNPLMN